MKTNPIVVCLLVLLTSASAIAQDGKPKPKPKTRTIDPQKVDQDYAIQGEYTGEVNLGEGNKIGVQVIANGDGKFTATEYTGGLPGDGFDGETISQYTGKRTGDEVVFTAGKTIRVIKDGAMIVTDENDTPLGTFKKVDRKSPTLGVKPPKIATVLFNGRHVNQWQPGKMSDDKLLMQGALSRILFQDHQLHVEFLLPYCPTLKGQARGNSGLYLQGRYEVQMLDSFGLKAKHDDCGGIYKTHKPAVNMCFPPLRWQTYDVDFTAATYDDQGKLTAKPRVTVKHNGVVIHDDVELPKRTTASPLKDGPEPGPVFLQDHKNPVRYRNIWVVEK